MRLHRGSPGSDPQKAPGQPAQRRGVGAGLWVRQHPLSGPGPPYQIRTGPHFPPNPHPHYSRIGASGGGQYGGSGKAGLHRGGLHSAGRRRCPDGFPRFPGAQRGLGGERLPGPGKKEADPRPFPRTLPGSVGQGPGTLRLLRCHHRPGRQHRPEPPQPAAGRGGGREADPGHCGARGAAGRLCTAKG